MWISQIIFAFGILLISVSSAPYDVNKKAGVSKKIVSIQTLIDYIQENQQGEAYTGEKPHPSEEGMSFESKENKVVYLMYAVARGQMDEIRRLVKSNDDQIVKDWVKVDHLRPPIHVAIYAAKKKANDGAAKETIDLMVMKGAPVDQYDSDGLAGIHVATSLGKTECLEAVIEAGSDIYIRSKKGSFLPIEFAAATCPAEVEELTSILLGAAGKNAVNYLLMKDARGKNAVHMAKTRRCAGFLRVAEKYLSASAILSNSIK